jgi:hypothetical protein
MATQRLDEEEAQGGGMGRHAGGGQLPRVKQVRLILPDLFRPELIRGPVKILGKIADDPKVEFCGTMRIITALEFFQHFLA